MPSSLSPRLPIVLLLDEFGLFAAAIGILGYGNVDAALQVDVERGRSACREVGSNQVYPLHVVDSQFAGSILGVDKFQFARCVGYIGTVV